jgi:hypothetical protein
MVKRRRRSLVGIVWLGLLLLVSGCNVPGLSAPAREPLDLTIVHTGQVYGEILPCG